MRDGNSVATRGLFFGAVCLMCACVLYCVMQSKEEKERRKKKKKEGHKHVKQVTGFHIVIGTIYIHLERLTDGWPLLLL